MGALFSFLFSFLAREETPVGLPPPPTRKLITNDTMDALPTPPTPQAVNSKTYVPPPIDGSLSLPQIIDYHLHNTKNHPVFRFERGDGNLRTLLWPEVAQGVHRAAKIITKLLGGAPGAYSANAPVVSFLAQADSITYWTMIHGAIRAGYRAFPISPRNSPAAIVHLLNKTGSHLILVSNDPPMQALAAATREALEGAEELLAMDEKERKQHEVKWLSTPSFHDFYPSEGVDPNFEELPPMAKPDLSSSALILHSSGSTSFPKPIPITHRILLQWSRIPWYGKIDTHDNVIGAVALPMFHAMGVILTTQPFTTGIVLGVFPPSSPPVIPTPESVLAGMRSTQSTIAFCVPTFIETWSHDPEAVKFLASLKYILFGGAPLTQSIGDELAEKGVPLTQVYGVTEIGCVNQFIDPDVTGKNWTYLSLGPQNNSILVPQDDGTDTYEIQVLASEASQLAVVNANVDGTDAYATSDLVLLHPTNPNLFRVFGRADDQIMLSTGEKTNPGPLEAIILKDPHIQGAVMFGRGKFQNGILIEPRKGFQFDPTNAEKLSDYRNLIWPAVEQANEFAPTHSRLFKEMIVVASPEKPFAYTPKGSVRRPIVLGDYAEEIEAAYKAVEESSQADIDPPASWKLQDVTEFVTKLIGTVMKDEVTSEDDIFQHGCDSLQATYIRNSVIQVLRKADISVRSLPLNFVYTAPSIQQLSRYIAAVADPENNDVADPIAAKAQEIDELVAKHTANFHKHTSSKPAPLKETIFLTGSTGGLGSTVLAKLVAMDSVERIYAVNRPSKGSNVKERQQVAFEDKGLDVELLSSEKIVFVEGDTSAEGMAISESLYNEIRDSVTFIIHNAWRVDFNLALSSFNPLIRGVRNIVDLSLASPHPEPPRVLFASSIGVFRNWASSEAAPEKPITEAAIPIGNGYSESKWAAERILETAAKETPLRPIIVRIGQLSGGANGSWNQHEWLPAIVRSGQVIGCLPGGEDDISWIPLGAGASAIIEMRKSPVQNLHLTHPRSVPWSAVFNTFSKELNVPLVPYHEWLSRLVKSVEGKSETEEARKNPALKLLTSFQTYAAEGDKLIGRDAMGVVKLSATEAVKVAPALSPENLPGLGEADAKAWLAYWTRGGLLDPTS